MLDKRRPRRMNSVLASLADTVSDDYGNPLDVGTPEAAAGATTPVYADIPTTSDYNGTSIYTPVDYGFTGDIPTTEDAAGSSVYSATKVAQPPAETPLLDRVGQFVQYGADIYRYVSKRNAGGQLVASPQKVAAAKQNSGIGKLLPILVIGYLLFA